MSTCCNTQSIWIRNTQWDIHQLLTSFVLTLFKPCEKATHWWTREIWEKYKIDLFVKEQKNKNWYLVERSDYFFSIFQQRVCIYSSFYGSKEFYYQLVIYPISPEFTEMIRVLTDQGMCWHQALCWHFFSLRKVIFLKMNQVEQKPIFFLRKYLQLNGVPYRLSRIYCRNSKWGKVWKQGFMLTQWLTTQGMVRFEFVRFSILSSWNLLLFIFKTGYSEAWFSEPVFSLVFLLFC